MEFVWTGPNGKQSSLWGEPFGWWRDFAAEVRLAAEMWGVRREEPERFRGSLEIGDDGEVYFWIPPMEEGEEKVAEPCIPFDRLARLRKRGSDEIERFWRDQIATDAVDWSEIEGELLVSSNDFHPERPEMLKQRDPSFAANFLVADLINAGLKARASPTVHWGQNDQAHHLGVTPHVFARTAGNAGGCNCIVRYCA